MQIGTDASKLGIECCAAQNFDASPIQHEACIPTVLHLQKPASPDMLLYVDLYTGDNVSALKRFSMPWQ